MERGRKSRSNHSSIYSEGEEVTIERSFNVGGALNKGEALNASTVFETYDRVREDVTSIAQKLAWAEDLEKIRAGLGNVPGTSRRESTASLTVGRKR